MSRMAAVIEVPQLESWFLVDWPDSGPPGVLMEFATKGEADSALREAFGDVTRRPGTPFRLIVRSALAMMEEPELRRALADWDLEFSQA
jgi:hypothetical protein